MLTPFPRINYYLNSIKNLVPVKRGYGTILLYHRVFNTQLDPYRLCVSRSNFEKQIKWLKNNRKVIPLSEFTDKLRSKTIIDKNYVCITFDDGYEDNYLNALPILAKYKIPATIFVTSSYVNNGNYFYWDTESKGIPNGRPMFAKQLQTISKSSLIEIGSHTLTHPHLSHLNFQKKKNEIKMSKENLENIIKKEVKSFSYPFGTFWDIDLETVRIVRDTGYSYACANFRGKAQNSSDLFLIPRIVVRNWNLEEFRKQLKNFI